MKRFSEQFKKQADSITLKSSERADLRDRLTAYMEYHPLPAHLRTAAPEVAVTGLRSQPFVAVPINWFFVRGSAAAFMLLMVITVPVAAEYTAPGDTLYPVKVRFNEEVRSSLTLNPYEKIEWETERLERRIAEARLLASEGKLTDEVEAEVAVAIKAHSDSAKAQIAELRETDQDEAAIAEIAFATALSVQSEVLGNTIAAAEREEGTEAGEDGHTAGSVLATLVAEETTAAAASQAASVPSYGKLVARVEMETTAAFELFASVKTQATPEQVADIERRLQDIERKVTAAAMPPTAEAATVADASTATSSEVVSTDVPAAPVDELPDEAQSTSTVDDAATASSTPVVEELEAVVVTPAMTEADAIVVLRSVLIDLRKLIAYMTDLDVRSSVSVDELVPITLTDEERQTAINEKLTIMRLFLETTATDTFTGPGADKINFQMTEVDRLVAETEAALGTGGLETAETLAQNGVALVADIEGMIAFFGSLPAAEPLAEEAAVPQE